MTDDQIRTEDGRLDVLTALYHRRTGAHEATTISTVFLARRDYTIQEVANWLADLQKQKLVESSFPPKSAIRVWTITEEGIAHKERMGR